MPGTGEVMSELFENQVTGFDLRTLAWYTNVNRNEPANYRIDDMVRNFLERAK